jgi:hypothetical protein
MNSKVIPLDYYVPGEPVMSGEGLPPKKGDVHGEHRVKTVVQNYFGPAGNNRSTMRDLNG